MSTTATTSETDAAVAAASAAMLPEPGDTANLSAAGADELISRLADQQIDDLLEASVAPDAEAAVDRALQAASELPKLGDQLVAAAATELQAELDQIASTRAAAAPASTATETPSIVQATPVAQTPSLEERFADSTIESNAVDPNAESVEQSSLTEAAATLSAPSFAPARHVDAQPAVAATETLAPTIVKPPEDLSDADAVARELAADVAMLSSPLPGVVAQQAAEAQEPAGDPWWRTAIGALLAIPMWLLQAINLPVRPLSDRGREIIGAAGVVTLVNAAGLIIYLAVFAPRH